MRRFLPLMLALAALPAPVPAADRDTHDKAIRDLAGRFFDAYASKDLDAFMALWSDKSPDYEARKKTMAGLFEQTGPIELKSLAVVRVRRDGDAASVRVRVELAGNDLKTGKLHPFLGALDRVLDLARQGAGWKVLRYGPSDRWLMGRLAEAKSKAERLRLLDDDTDLVGFDFVEMVLNEADAQARRGQFEQASALEDLAFEAAAGLGDPDALAWCHYYRGRAFQMSSRLEPALASNRKALALFREANDRNGERKALYSIGVVYAHTGRYAQALQAYQDSLTITRELGDRATEAPTLNNIGVVYHDTGRHAEALQAYQDSLKIKRDLGDRASEAQTLHNMGDAYNDAGCRAEALQAYLDCLKITRELGDRAAEAQTLDDIGNVYANTGRYAEALQAYQDSLKIKRDIGDRAGEAKALLNIGGVYEATGRYAEALRQYQDNLTIARELKDRTREARALLNIGVAYDDMGRYPEALQHYQDSLTIARELKDRVGEENALNGIGIVYKAAGRYGEALRQYQDSLAIARDLRHRAGEAKALTNIGNVYEATGRYGEALRQHQDALKMRHDLGDRAGEAKALNNIGNVYADTGRYGEALRQYQDSLTMERDLGDRAGETATLDNIGTVYADTGRYAEALRQYQDALKIRHDLGDRAGEAATLNNIGTVYEETGRYVEALRQYQDSLTIKRDLGDRAGEAATLNNIGVVYVKTGRYAEALRQYQDSLKITRDLGDRAVEATVLQGIGIVYRNTSRYGEALREYQDSLKIRHDLGDRAGEAATLNNIGVVYEETGRYAEARRQFEDALGIAESVGDLRTTYYCRYSLGRTHQAQGQWRDAARAYRDAVRVAELLRTNTREPSLQTSLLAEKTAPLFRRAQCLLELGQPAEAFAAAERMKARGLVDLLREGKADLRRGMSDEERKQEQALQDRLTALGVQLENLHSRKADADRQAGLADDLKKARQDYEAFRRELYLRLPDLATRRAEFTPASLDDLGSSLFAGRPGLVVLSYLVGDQETLLFVLTAGDHDGGPARLTIHRIDLGSKDLAEAVGAFRDACSDPGKGEPDADDLYRWLLAPAADQLADAKQLIVIPDGVLHTLPFQALKDPDGKYLIERFAVSYAPSVTALVKMEELGAQRRKEYAGRPSSLLAVGVSDFGRRERPLPAAEQEAQAVAAAFGDGAKLLPGKEATRAKLEAAWGSRRYLHFATHGRLNSDAPLYSSLVLSSNGDGDEGVLYAQELVDGAEIPAELAVMSACQTGLGKHVNGEGLQGLSWAWFTAGVPSTVASQWSVGDDSTARLMKVFYARLKAGDSKAEALRQAALALLQDDATRHPFYWAPFVLVGDDR